MNPFFEEGRNLPEEPSGHHNDSGCKHHDLHKIRQPVHRSGIGCKFKYLERIHRLDFLLRTNSGSKLYLGIIRFRAIRNRLQKPRDRRWKRLRRISKAVPGGGFRSIAPFSTANLPPPQSRRDPSVTPWENRVESQQHASGAGPTNRAVPDHHGVFSDRSKQHGSHSWQRENIGRDTQALYQNIVSLSFTIRKNWQASPSANCRREQNEASPDSRVGPPSRRRRQERTGACLPVSTGGIPVRMFPPPTIAMHNLPTRRIVRHYRAAALMILLKWLLITGGIPLLAYAKVIENRELGYYAIAGLSLAGLFSLGHWVVGARARCPLCFVPSFSHRQQAKSRKALHFLGSYRFFVALSVIFKGFFRCPYCGERTAMQARARRHG